MNAISRLTSTLDEKGLRHLPTQAAMRTRIRLLRKRGAQIGRNVFIGTGVRILHPPGLIIEDDVIITRDVVLDARGGLTLRQHALIGFESILLSQTHRSDAVGIPIQRQGNFTGPVDIGQRTWLGTRTVILPGVSTASDTIIGSGAVVTSSLIQRGIYGGVPARLIGNR